MCIMLNKSPSHLGLPKSSPRASNFPSSGGALLWEAVMQVLWPEKVKSHFRVYHPINSGGTTWLRESDLVFVHKRPYAVLSWSHTDRGDVPEKFCELNRKLLKHDRPDDLFYRYEGEIKDPRG